MFVYARTADDSSSSSGTDNAGSDGDVSTNQSISVHSNDSDDSSDDETVGKLGNDVKKLGFKLGFDDDVLDDNLTEEDAQSISLNGTDSSGDDSSDGGSYSVDGSDDETNVEKLGFDDDDLDDGLIEDANETEEELWRLTVKGLKVKLVERGLIQSGAKAELIERLMNPQPADFKNKPKVESWRNSKAKALLIRFLMNESSPFHLLSPDEAWESSEWFKQYPKDRFIKNMSNLKNALAERNTVVQHDNETILAELAALKALDSIAEPRRNYPLWHEHEASRLLEEDLKNNLNEGMLPAEFQKTRPEYCEFPDFIFRKHIYQQQRKQREMPMKIHKRNKLAEKKHQQEAEEEAVRWHADREYDDEVNDMFELRKD